MIQNKRDLGGIRTADGKMIQPGRLIRSGHLFKAEEQDLSGISAVIDLRTPGEQKETPDRVFGREYLPMPVFPDTAIGISHEVETNDRRIPDLAVLYGRLMRECSASFRNILLTIMRHDFHSGAVLWHCTEGKDRCGMTTALVLEMLGVDRDTILKDYLKTNLVNLPKAVRIRDRLTPARGEEFARSVYQAYIADERYLRAAWDAMGPDYLHETLHLEDADIGSFRETILNA